VRCEHLLIEKSLEITTFFYFLFTHEILRKIRAHKVGKMKGSSGSSSSKKSSDGQTVKVDEQEAAANLKLQESVKRSTAIYYRLTNRKNAADGTETASSSVSFRDKVSNFFGRESADVRLIRSSLKSYRQKLHFELQTISKSNVKHRKRVTDQYNEFKKQEKQLSNWGLKFAIPAFRMQVSIRS
jgi:hypothetical protein